MISVITDENYEREVTQSNLPCIIEFTAGWCTMCDALRPTFEALAERFASEAKFCVTNIDEERGLRIKFAVASLPTVAFVSNGKKTVLTDELTTEKILGERIRFMLDGGTAPNTTPLKR